MRKVKKSLQDYIVNAGLGTIGLWSLGSLGSDWGGDPPWSYVLWASLGSSVLGLAKFNSPSQKTTWGWQSLGSEVLSLQSKFTDNQGFIFRGQGIPASIPEDRMGKFLGTAKHRQIKARYGGWKTIKEKDILSQRHFTRSVSPPFFREEYRAILKILDRTQLLDKRERGHSGYLLGIEFMTESAYLEIIIDRWSILNGHPGTTRNIIKHNLVGRIFN